MQVPCASPGSTAGAQLALPSASSAKPNARVFARLYDMLRGTVTIVQFAAESMAIAALILAAGPALAADWGPPVFEEARRANRPVVLLIADPACARCRLDEADALAEPRAAELLRREFLFVRVDRYERPDLDDLFTTAGLWVSNESGYPLVAALLPDGRPYAVRAGLAGEDRGERPSMHRFALRAWSEFTHDRAAAEERAARVAEALARAQEASPGADGALAEPALKGLEQAFDPRLGGFGSAEAFAPPGALRLLLAFLERGEDARARRLLDPTLDALAASDPAPETLARRALLLEAFARAVALRDSPLHRARAASLAEGALRMRDADGAFVAFEEPGAAPRVLAGWNGLMIGALALSGAALDRPQDVEAARTAARRVLDRLGPPARLRRAAGAASPAQLEDQAFLAEGLLRLHAALGGRERRWADEAAALAEASLGSMDAVNGGFFDSLAGPERFVPAALPQRLRSGYDGALPSANGVMAAVLYRLSRAVAQPRYEDLARRTVLSFAEEMRRAPRGMEGLAAAAVEMPPASAPSPAPEAALPPSDARDGIRFEASLSPDPQRRGQPFTLRLRIDVPPGRFVVAHDPGARDLVGLSVSVATAEVAGAGPPRYPPGERLEGRWDSGPVNVHARTALVEVPLRLPANAARLPARVRVRAVFQPCRDRAATCDRPDAVLLDVPVRVATP
jgi:uncharacterized protein